MNTFLDKLKFWGVIAIVGIILLWMMVGTAIKWILLIVIPVFIILWVWGTWLPKNLKNKAMK